MSPYEYSIKQKNDQRNWPYGDEVCMKGFAGEYGEGPQDIPFTDNLAAWRAELLLSNPF